MYILLYKAKQPIVQSFPLFQMQLGITLESFRKLHLKHLEMVL